ncbi:MAG: hypothetical protein KAV82_03700 [Phycisphaerae bacterium]|nr:hypothetical protein [Phycisphaerae bacterium]
MNRLKREKQIEIVKHLVEGTSIRSTERITGVYRDTILRLLVRVSEHYHRLMDERMRHLAPVGRVPHG